MPQVETKSVSYVNCINWNGVSPSIETFSGGMKWSWAGATQHTIEVTHTDGTSQTIAGDGKIVVTRYDGSVYNFFGA